MYQLDRWCLCNQEEGFKFNPQRLGNVVLITFFLHACRLLSSTLPPNPDNTVETMPLSLLIQVVLDKSRQIYEIWSLSSLNELTSGK